MSLQDSFVLHPLSQPRQQPLVIDPVEERQINVHNGCVAARQMFPRLGYRGLRPRPRRKPWLLS